ncbi:MAG: hypothetical protein V2J26_04970 [Pacificimonas sp.]|nr:hypothetical protein [Pacificimonas sp.]
MGVEPTLLRFADQDRELFFDTDVGDVVLNRFTGAPPTLPDAQTRFPSWAVMTSEAVGGFSEGSVTVFGSISTDQHILIGPQLQLLLDGSFNRGGDTLEFAGQQADFGMVRNGSALIISADDGTEVVLPLGISGTILAFEDAQLKVSFDVSADEVRFETVSDGQASPSSLAASALQGDVDAVLSVEPLIL